MKPLAFPSLQIFVGSQPNNSREWINRLVHGYGHPEALNTTPMLNLDASLIEQSEVPASGDPILDARHLDPGLFSCLSSDSIDLLGELQKGRFRHLRFAPRKLLKLADASSGSRNSPTMGCVNTRYSRAEIVRLITEQLRRILTNRAQVDLLDADISSPAGNIWVVLTFGIVGGTGPAALEVAAITREVARSLNLPITLVGLALLPGAFQATSEQRALANAYAVKKELQAAQSGRLARAVEHADGELRITQSRAFDLVFLVEDKNAASELRARTLATNGLSGLLGMVSHFLYRILYTPLGAAIRSRLHDDMADQLASRDEYGLATNFCSFGDAQIYLPERELRLFVPPYLSRRLAVQIMGEELDIPAGNDLLNRLLTTLGLGDENMTGLLERLTLTTNADGFPQPFSDVLHARFRRLAILPLAVRRNSINAAMDELERALGETLEVNTPKVALEMSAQVDAEVQRLEHEAGLTALIQVAEAAHRYLDDQLRLAQDDLETYVLARKAAQEQRAGAEGHLTNGLDEGAASQEAPFWAGLLPNAEADIANERRERQLNGRAFAFLQAARDEMLLSVEVSRRTHVASVLERLGGQLREVTDKAREILAVLGTVVVVCTEETQRIEDLDFAFQVPIGVCLLRPGVHRRDDLEWFSARLLVDNSIDEALAIVRQRIREEKGDLMKRTDFSDLKAEWESYFHTHLRPHLDAYTELHERFTPEQVSEYLRLCIRGSAEYLRSNSAVNHDNRHRIRFIGAPQAWHSDLRQWLVSTGESSWFLVDSGDASRLTFTQVRVGVPMHSLSGNSGEKEAYERQSERHNEERMHTEPVMRLQPELDPIENSSDPRLKRWLLMAAATGSIEHKANAFWYRSWANEWEKMGEQESDITAFLLQNQDHLHEIASRFTTQFKTHGGAHLTSSLLDFASHPNGMAGLVNGESVASVLREVGKLALSYGEPPI